jgi:uncharacterized protein (DUF488 family)
MSHPCGSPLWRYLADHGNIAAMSAPALVSLGYEGRSAEELIASLQRESVTVLVDVRLTPLSRKPGLSKQRLAQALEVAGIRYVHLRALGNPPDNRSGFRAGDPRSVEHFRDLLRERSAVEALDHVVELLDGETVALLCFERRHEACHRHVVAEELRRANPAVAIVEA